MKKVSLLAAVVSSFFLAVNSAFAHDVVLDFKGKVTKSTCEIEGSTEGKLTKLVTLSDVSTNALSKVGDVAGMQAVVIKLQKCTGTKFEARFNGLVQSVDEITGALINKLESSSNGSNVQVQLLDSQYQPIKLGIKNTPVTVETAGDEASVGFYAQYLAAYASATAGEFQSQIMLDFSYE
ncbi:fimbrial protein [Pseudomonas sp. LD120]|uniref:fimbrial protein n=1 Tax=Pseudomonas sp. LD120 TaxID=485751 RepID=UPI001357BC3E|nr:fimbrial protein [Pseudomonas sp. LD120]KAF0865418.1 hypothetical protein PLD_09060 [Pseudomonas sp. LD120]